MASKPPRSWRQMGRSNGEKKEKLEKQENENYNECFAPVAQLDRALGYEPRGRGFDSCRARLMEKKIKLFISHLKGARATEAEVLSLGEGSTRVIVGRDPQCQLCLHPTKDTLVSRRHAEISLEGNALFILDLESRNGLYVNGTRISRHMLRHGDRVSLGLGGAEFLVEFTSTLPARDDASSGNTTRCLE